MSGISSTTKNRFKFLSLDEKVAISLSVINFAYTRMPVEKLALAWTGGKDSTLLLWLIRQYAEKYNSPLPKIVFIDEGDTFQEVKDFVNQLSKKWQFHYDIAKNNDVLRQVKKIGDIVSVKKLNDVNKRALLDLGFDDDAFPFEPESLVGNHLMKTVACNMWLEQEIISGLFVGVRWDEQKDRSLDTFIRKISSPLHARIEPLLHFTERDVWELTHAHNIPVVSLYSKGYRSLGAKSTTEKHSNLPAWEQDFELSSERAGRHQDKEKIMKRLRDLGYM